MSARMTAMPGSRRPMVARNHLQEVANGNRTLRSWLAARGCDETTITRIRNENRWRYGRWRPSYRAVLLVDGRATDISDVAAD